MMEASCDWEQCKDRLFSLFSPKAIGFRFAGPVRATPEGKFLAQVVAYVPAHVLQAKLNKVLGPENWAFSWSPLAVSPGGVVLSAKGSLSLANFPPKEGLGEAFLFPEPGEDAVAEALRSCALMWGIGQYLKGLDLWVEVSSAALETWALSEADVARLRARLPAPSAPAASAAVTLSVPKAPDAGAMPPALLSPSGASMPAPLESDGAAQPEGAVALSDHGSGSEQSVEPAATELIADDQWETYVTLQKQAGGDEPDLRVREQISASTLGKTIDALRRQLEQGLSSPAPVA